MKYTIQEWRVEGVRRFGKNIENWKFICPACGRINTGREFKEAGAKTNDIHSTCIGRHNGKGVSGAKHKIGAPPPEFGCDWAAFGLFRTLFLGDIVVDDDGKETDVFSFAPADTEHHDGEAAVNMLDDSSNSNSAGELWQWEP